MNTRAHRIARVLFGMVVLLPMIMFAPHGADASAADIITEPASAWSTALSEFGEPSLLGFLQSFWQSAWGLEFVEEQSGMVLVETMDPLVWQVLVTNGAAEDPIVAEGTFMLACQVAVWGLAVDPNDLAGTPILAFEHAVFVGTIIGSTGFESPLYGVLVKVVVLPPDPNDPPVTTYAFTPLQVCATLDDAIARGSAAARAYGKPDLAAVVVPLALEPVPPPGEPMGPGTDGGAPAQSTFCADQEALCRQQADEVYTAQCEEIVAAAVTAATACGFASIPCNVFYLACLAACDATTLTAEVLCLDAAAHRRDAAYLGCEAARNECEHVAKPKGQAS